MFRAIVLWAMAAATAWAGPNVDAFATHAARALAADAPAAQEADRTVRQKIVGELGLPETVLDQARVSFVAAGYRIHLAPECSTDAENLLADTSYRTALERQAQSAASFLADFHSRLLGNTTEIFGLRNIALCTDPIGASTPRLSYDRFGQTLRLHVGARWPRRTPRRPTTFSASDLRRLWSEGAHWRTPRIFTDRLRRRWNPIRRYWPLLDPIGEVRTALREALRREGWRRAIGLERLDIESLGALAARLLDPTRALQLRVVVENGKLAMLGDEWKRRLTDPTTTEQLGLAAALVFGGVVRPNENIDVSRLQIGLINVENFHRIDVRAFVGAFAEHFDSAASPRVLRIRTRQFGLINVSTADDVSVAACLAVLVAPGHFEKAALAASLEEVR